MINRFGSVCKTPEYIMDRTERRCHECKYESRSNLLTDMPNRTLQTNVQSTLRLIDIIITMQLLTSRSAHVNLQLIINIHQ